MVIGFLLQALLATLGHFIWQAAIISGALAIALRLELSSRVRYGYACSALLSMLTAAIVTFVVSYATQPMPGMVVTGTFPGMVASSWRMQGPIYLLMVWAMGASIMLSRAAAGMFHIIRVLKRKQALVPQFWQDRVAELSVQLGIRRVVKIAACAHVHAPIVVGYLRPIILVPFAFVTELPPSTVDAILYHELWHIKRHDWIVNTTQVLMESLFFYHPCVHWVSRVIRDSREDCCDDHAVKSFGDPIGYARALVSLEDFRSQALTFGLSSTGASLMSRINRIVCPVDSTRSGRGVCAMVLAAACVLALGTVPALACTSTASMANQPQIARLPEKVTRWSPELTRAAQAHGVDPELLAIVTMVESGGNPNAVSPAGAIGLTQVMPGTGQAIAIERGIVDYSPEKLRDPAYNLDFGAYYLARQLEAFGSIELAVAAYNGGPDAVRDHLTHGKPLSQETDLYRRNILRLWDHRNEKR